MGYSTDRYIGYGINIGESENWADSLKNLGDPDSFYGAEGALEDLIYAEYPLLSQEFDGDTRDGEGDIIIVVTSTVVINPSPLENHDKTVSDVEGKSQLSRFIATFLSEDDKGDWLYWECTA
jgi:hypothetical protein